MAPCLKSYLSRFEALIFFYFPGNVKQVLTILFAVTIFDLTITKTNAFGILLTLIGGAWYAAVDYREKKSHNYRG